AFLICFERGHAPVSDACIRPKLYQLTLQRSSAITHAIYGNFSAPKAQEIVCSRYKTLELLRPDDSGKVQSILSVEIFGVIRALHPFRLTGASRDYIVVASDSGRIVILEYDGTKNMFEKVHQETFGKTGCRRIVPGQYLAVDPKGRAVMIGAIEKQKFVYILNRDSAARLTISSPLEAHKSYTLVYAMVGMDVGFENPLFASIELSYEEVDKDPQAEPPQKMLTLYEMDLGLNHVTRKFADAVDHSAHALIAVPGGVDGPSGVLVCCENCLVYKKQGHPDVVCAIPRRLEMAQEKGLLIVAHATHKLKDFFFFLIQSEYGDLYKVTLTHDEDLVSEVQVKYFDTVPLSNALCVLKTGFLFAAAEFGNHALYQFQGIGTDEEDPMCTSSHPHGAQALVAFKPRTLKNLMLYDEMPSLSPIIDMKVLDATGEGKPQLYAMCGRGPRASLRVLRHGLAVTEMAVSELPGKPNAVWTVKATMDSEYDRYIVVSFVDVTLVLSIGDTVEEVLDSGFLATAPSLLIQLMADDSYVQVHPTGIRHLLPRRTNEWRVPGQKRIVTAAANERQVVIALSGGEILYFEIDESHTLNEVAKRDMNYEVLCIAVQPVPENRQRASFTAVGGLALLPMPLRFLHQRGNGENLQSILPQPTAGSRVPWEERFLETDGWEGYEDVAASDSDPKWWHVPDEKIAELIQGRTREVRRRSSAPVPVLPSPSQEPAGPLTEGTKGAEDSKAASKPWKVSDDAILRLIQDTEARQSSALSKTGAELLSMPSVEQVHKTVPKPRVVCIRVAWVGTGETIALHVPLDLPIDPQPAHPGHEESTELSRTRRPGASRATRASLALQRLLPEASAASAAKGRSLEPAWHRRSRSQTSLKGMLESITGIPPSLQRLVHDKHLCRAGATLKEIGVVDGDQITLVVVPRLPNHAESEELAHRGDFSKGVVKRKAGRNFHVVHPWRWGQDAKPSKEPSGFVSSDIHLSNAGDKTLFKLREKLGMFSFRGVDNTIRILSLERERPLKQLSAQALQSPAESVCLLEMKNLGQAEDVHSLFLSIGLSSGILIRSVVDFVTGTLSDQRSRFLGAKAVRLHKVSVQGMPSMLALSTKPWLSYNFQGKNHCTPMSYEQLEFASSFASEQCPEGFVAISGNTLRILACERLGELFNQTVMNLSYTPRRFVPLPPAVLPPPGQPTTDPIMLAILEADHNAYNEETKREIRAALKKIRLTKTVDDELDDVKDEDDEEDLPEQQVGTFKAGEGKWGSCVRIVNPSNLLPVFKLDLDIDEAALCLTVCYFSQLANQPCLVVGTVYNMTLYPRHAPKATIKTYMYDERYHLQLIHSTPLDDVPLCLFPFEGRLLASVGKCLRIYELGKRKLLRKCEYKNIPEGLMWMHVKGDKIFTADLRESFHIFKYRRSDNQLFVLSDDQAPRWTTCATVLDSMTMAGADKFDNFFISRIPDEAKGDEGGDHTGLRLKADTAYLTGATPKLDSIVQFHVGDTVTALEKTTLAQGGSELICYSTLLGAIGAFYPFAGKDELDFFQHLEMFVRAEKPPLCGRDHIMYRSYHFPVQSCVDGDLCEQFMTLTAEKQRLIASELDRTPAEIIKKLEDMRNRLI
ncbi:Sf3b3, partial [Symbiodinium microadriaticum]